MLVHLRRSIVISIIFLVLCGLAYPLAGTGVSQLFFKHQADGSLGANGSTLIGQSWSGPNWFQGRPDGTALSPGPGGVLVSGVTNLGPRSKALEQAVAKQAAALRKQGVTPTNNLVTTSFSGVDPDILPSDAYAQAETVARTRNLPVGVVRKLIADHVHTRELGFLGNDYVNVLELNEALARIR